MYVYTLNKTINKHTKKNYVHALPDDCVYSRVHYMLDVEPAPKRTAHADQSSPYLFLSFRPPVGSPEPSDVADGGGGCGGGGARMTGGWSPDSSGLQRFRNVSSTPSTP